MNTYACLHRRMVRAIPYISVRVHIFKRILTRVRRQRYVRVINTYINLFTYIHIPTSKNSWNYTIFPSESISPNAICPAPIGREM